MMNTLVQNMFGKNTRDLIPIVARTHSQLSCLIKEYTVHSWVTPLTMRFGKPYIFHPNVCWRLFFVRVSVLQACQLETSNIIYISQTDDAIDYIYTAMFLRDFPSWHHEDPANCLSTQLGGVFVEGGEEHFPRLRAQYELRENVKIMLEPSDPKSVRSFWVQSSVKSVSVIIQ